MTTLNQTAALAQLMGLPDGTYILRNDPQKAGAFLVEDYAAKWSYGFIVATGPMVAEDVYPGRIFGVWWDPDAGALDLDKVIHVDTRIQADQMAKQYQQKAIFDMLKREVVYV